MMRRSFRLFVCLAVGTFLLAAEQGRDFDPDEVFKIIMRWEKPDPYPPPMLEGMDIATLSIMLDSGNLQWYEPRPVEESWDGVVGMKVHAPADVVWEVMVDHELQCVIMSDTFDSCKTESRNGNEVRNVFKIHTSVFMYSYNMDMVDVVKEDPPYHMHIDTVEGQLTGRELNILLVPIENKAQTLLFIRYYGPLRGIGSAMRLVMAVIPQAEPPTSVGAAIYHARSYKNEAEKRVGYKAPRKPKSLKIENLDIRTLRLINDRNGGLIRETPEGKSIDALTYTFADAPPERVWEVATDFEHWTDTFPNSQSEILSIDGNTVVTRQKMTSYSVLVFDIGFEMYNQYNLEPPHHLHYESIDGTYRGSGGDLRLMPLENGTRTLMFGTGSVNLEHDDGLVSRVAKTGAFPLENMLNLVGAQSLLAYIRVEAERREGNRSR
jgi:carbon monoxide dehydrogenase subunit G